MRLGSITKALLVPFLLLAIDGEKKANAIILPNISALPAPGKKEPPKAPPIEEKQNLKEHEKVKKEIAELENLATEMVVNPEKFKDKSIAEIQQKLAALRILKDFRRQQEQFQKQEAIDKLKWEDQDGLKQPWGNFNPPLKKGSSAELDKNAEEELKRKLDKSLEEIERTTAKAKEARERSDHATAIAKNFGIYGGSGALLLTLALLIVLKKKKADREYLSSPDFNRKTLKMLNQFIPDSKTATPNKLLANLAISGNISEPESLFIKQALSSTNLPSCIATQIGLQLYSDKKSFVYVQKTDDIKTTLKELGINDLENVDLKMNSYTTKIKVGKKNLFLILYKGSIPDYPKAFSIFEKEYTRIAYLQSDKHKNMPIEKVEQRSTRDTLKTMTEILNSRGLESSVYKQGFISEIGKLVKMLEKIDSHVLEQYMQRLRLELKKDLGPELMDEIFRNDPVKILRLLMKEPDPEFGFFIPGKPLESYSRSLN